MPFIHVGADRNNVCESLGRSVSQLPHGRHWIAFDPVFHWCDGFTRL